MFIEYLEFRRWLIYLRKSRQDDSSQTVEEVLSKHYEILQEYAIREFGGEIPEENIYREVISGESIDERSEIKKVLARIEDPNIIGVLVVEPSRLSRGDLTDCARIINAFRFSKTLVGTPMMTYNLENKMERKMFQDELLRGNDYLEYTKELLERGRIAAVKRGAYIGHKPPYGYDRAMKGGEHSLEENENGDIVRMIFSLYVEDGLTRSQIAHKLNDMNVPGPSGGKWHKDAIRYILANIHYIGKVSYFKTKTVLAMENGALVKKHIKQPESEVITAEGKHDAIIDIDTWNKAQALFEKPRVGIERQLQNPLAGLLVCGGCGKALHRKSYVKTTEDRYVCRSSPVCYRSIRMKDVIKAVIYALEQSELPKLELKVRNGEGNARKIQERLVKKLEKELEEYIDREEHLHELLETKVYTRDVFEKRKAKLLTKMEECQSALYKAKANLPENVDFEERVVALENAIAALKDPEMSVKDKNRFLKTIVKRIEYIGPPSAGMNRKDQKHGNVEFTLNITLRL